VVFLTYLFLFGILIFSFRYSKYFYLILLVLLPGWGFLMSVLWNNFNFSAEMIRLLRGTKDFIIIGLLLSCVPELKRKKIFESMDSLFGIVVLVFFAFVLAAYFWGTQQSAFDLSSSSFDKTTSLRFYLLPFVLLFFGMANANSDTFLRNVIKILLGIGIMSGVCAIIEIFILPPDFLTQIGYTNYLTQFNNVQDYQTTTYGLPFTYFTENGIRRAGSFFSSGPLDMSDAMLVIVPLALFSYINKLFSARFTMTALVLSLISLLLSISRIAILILFLQVIYVIYSSGKRENSFVFKFKKFIPVGLLIIACAGIALIGFKGDLMEFIINSINLNDSSSIGHISSFISAFNIISSHLLGIGLGNNIVESFFLNVWIEAGVFTLICVLVIIFLIIKKAYLVYQRPNGVLVKVIAVTTLCSWVSLSIEISKSIVGWATILAFCSSFFFAGIIIANKLKEE
jgi:hypothetical protein